VKSVFLLISVKTHNVDKSFHFKYKTVPYGLRSENCFQISFTKIDPYGPRTEKKKVKSGLKSGVKKFSKTKTPTL
jgi:hypothetical protein